MLHRLSKEVGSQTAKRRSAKLFASLRSATPDAKRQKQLRGEYDLYCDTFEADKANTRHLDSYDLPRLRRELQEDARRRKELFVRGGGVPFATWRKGVPSLKWTVRASGLTNTDGVFGKSDPYFKISHCQIKGRDSGVNHYFSEPFFVPRPGSTREDDGVVLVPALDGATEKGVLYVLDAKNLEVLAKCD